MNIKRLAPISINRICKVPGRFRLDGWATCALVVEATNFHPDQSVRAATKHILYASENLEVTECFTLTAGDRIKYQFAMDDPDAYSEVWRGLYTDVSDMGCRLALLFE